MTFLEPIIAGVVGAGLTVLAVKVIKSRPALFLTKYGTLIRKSYDIIDPILDRNLQHWQGSQIDKAFEIVVEAVGDGTLTPKEVKQVAAKLAANWLPAVAADKVRYYQSLGEQSENLPEVKAALAVAEHIHGGISKQSALSAVRNLIKF